MINYSIIIPHKNSPELLDRCLASIPQRNDIEIIVVDDYSEENRRPQINREDVDVIYITKEESKGAGHARNVGIEAATGIWLVFADCDDYYINNTFDKLDAFRETEYDIIFYDYDTNNDTVPTTFANKLNAMFQGKRNARANFKHYSNAPWNRMFRAEFIKKYNILFEEVPIQNDAYFVHKASYLTDNFNCINEKLYFYEINNNGITRKKKRDIEDIKRCVTTTIKVDKLKAKSKAWKCIYWYLNEQYKTDYGVLFYYQQQLRRIKHGLIGYMINKFIIA